MSESQQKNPWHILIIDDDITSLDIISFLFEERGFEVERYSDGHAAIDYVKNTVPDLILVDLMMPKINGVETVKEIRGLGLDSVPILAFTAVDEPIMHEEARQAGCNEVITKPCPSDKLVKYIKKYLDV